MVWALGRSVQEEKCEEQRAENSEVKSRLITSWDIAGRGAAGPVGAILYLLLPSLSMCFQH
jgi:hypothetical protein